MDSLLHFKTHRLLRARASLNSKYPDDESGDWHLDQWRITGDWHEMTVDTNADKSSGLDGGLAVDCIGAWEGGVIEREITLTNFGEILFEHYVQNGAAGTQGEENSLVFTVDGVRELEITGPSPWQRCVPIGLTPGTHTIRFEYTVNGSPSAKKGVVDKIAIWESEPVNCLISGYTPPKPARSLGSISTLRGFTRFQEMAESDTEIKITAIFGGADYLNFTRNVQETFYFVDEFGVCYRGIFPDTINPKSIATAALYSVELAMTAGQKAGVGFCQTQEVLIYARADDAVN